MCIRRPGIGIAESGGEVFEFRCRTDPQAERTIDVHPGAGFLCNRADFGGRIERTGIHIAGLNTDQRRRRQRRQLVGTHATVVVRRYGQHAPASKTQQIEALQDTDVHFFADDDVDLWCAK